MESPTWTGRSWRGGLINEFPAFLGEVRKLMVAQQIPPGLVDIVCGQAEQLPIPMSDWHSNTNDFFTMIERVRDDTCKLQQDIERNRTNPVFLNEARTKLLGFTYVMVGLTCVSTTAFLLYPDIRNFIIALSGVLASTYFSLASQPPQIPINTPNWQANRIFRRRVAIPVILALFLILSTIITIRFTSKQTAYSIPTATAIQVTHPLLFGNIKATFYSDPVNSHNAIFDRTPANIPIFTQSFPSIAFNPDPSEQICGKSTGVNNLTRPFTDIFQNPDGSCKTIRAQDESGHMAGLGNLYSFEAVFITSITIPSKGFLTMQIHADDGWIISIGANSKNGEMPTPDQTNIMSHPPTGNESPIYKYHEMGDNNQPSSPTLFKIKVNFPTSGTYPIEIDYTECCGDFLTLVVTNVFTPTLS